MNPPAGRTLWAVLELLDRQIVDPDGRMVGKVDDLELEVPDDGGLPVVVAILTGPGALAGHVGGSVGKWLAAVERRVTDSGEPARIPFGVVTTIGSAIKIGTIRENLESNRGEQWVRDVIISKIPGAGHATD